MVKELKTTMNKSVTDKLGKQWLASMMMITAGAIVIGFLWIMCSSGFNVQGSPLLLYRVLQLGTLKGLFCVGVTGIFLFLVTEHFRNQQTADTHKELVRVNE